MEYLRVILFVLAIILIFMTLIFNFKIKKLLNSNKNILKTDLERYVKMYTILTIITGV